MSKSLLVLATGALIALAAPGHADVFSSQSFSGGTTTLQNLPGVNMDAGSSFSAADNCTETEVTSFSYRHGPANGVRTECQVGNFSFSTVRGRNERAPNDMTYGGNPPPWEQGWRPRQ